MLREWKRITQHPGEHRRRFFTDDYFDLYVWFGEASEIVGFELSYDTLGDCRAVRWLEGAPPEHYTVDLGESEFWQKRTPILVSDDSRVSREIEEEFQLRAVDLEGEIRELVGSKLHEYLSSLSTA